ncbi:MAG: glycosyltransferase [Thermogemmata sp.]|nr:glycosyltransferase [Thermogemmata sp.]
MPVSPYRLLTLGHSYVVRANRALAQALQRVGGERWQVRVVAPDYFHGTRDLRPVYFQAATHEAYEVRVVPAYGTRWVHWFVYDWSQLRRAMQGHWDIIHVWEEPYIVAGAELAAAAPRRARFVFRTAQSVRSWYPPPFCWLERYTLQRAAGWICSGQLVARHLQQRAEYARKPMALIPLGVDTERFAPQPAQRITIRRQLGWTSDDPPVVGFLGRLTEEKGIRILLQVLDALRVSWRALIIGAGPLETEVRRWAAPYGSQRVQLCTHVSHDDVPSYLNAMDLLVAPSQTTPRWKEQFGRMVIEAMACGIPVVGSDSGEIPYVIGDAGRIVPEKDVDQWIQILEQLLQDVVLRRELAQAGRQRVLTHYTWPHIAQQHLDFFTRLLEEGTTQCRVS